MKKKEVMHPMLHGHLQSKSSKLDESLGMRRGKESTKKQSYKSRRDESMSNCKVCRKMKKVKKGK